MHSPLDNTYPGVHFPSGQTDPWDASHQPQTPLPRRVPNSPQLRLYHEVYYGGWPVSQQPEYGGLVENYLHRSWEVIANALTDYPRVFAVRVDLRYPQSWPREWCTDNHCLKRFFESLQRELDNAGLKYPTRLHYIWAREQDRSPRPHYHLLLMLNQDAISQIGTYMPCQIGGYHRHNLFHRIARAWCYALGLDNDDQAEGLVHYAVSRQYDTDSPYGCDDPAHGMVTDHDSGQFRISRNGDGYELARLYFRASYLCKAYSKRFGEGNHCFGSSRRRRSG